VAKVTKHGRETIKDFIEDELADPIQQYWKGNLTSDQQSLAQDIKKDRENNLIQVYTQNRILSYLEFGVKPHVIKPDTADALRWFNDEGDPVFAQKVNHPGFDPFSHLRNAIDKRRNEVQ